MTEKIWPNYLIAPEQEPFARYKPTDGVYDLGTKRELFIDDFFIHSLEGDVAKRTHEMIPDDIILTLDEPHENTNNSAASYSSLLYDGKRYLFYYRAYSRLATKSDPEGRSGYILCVAESTDGINFRKSPVNLHASGYNVVLDSDSTACLIQNGEENVCPGVATAFYDTNPACPGNERYKMIVTNEKAGCFMFLFVSPDGYDFKLKCGPFKLGERSAFDSANQAFYDPNIGKYRLYHRGIRLAGPTWKRTIMTHVTEDFITFTEQKWLRFDEEFDSLFARGQELYTNGIRPYFRAPHILLGFPMRYVDGSVTPGMHLPSPYHEYTPNTDYDGEWNSRVFARPNLAIREVYVKKMLRQALAATEGVLITSRDGSNFTGVPESLIKPPPQDDSWVYGSGTVAIGMAVTKSRFGHGAPDELSFYAVEGNWSDNVARYRRYHIRMDGFVSLHFGMKGGIMVTPRFTFTGGRLSVNIATGALAGFSAEIRDENGCPIPGYSFEESLPEIGDDLEMIARWKQRGPDLRPLEGKVIQLAIRAYQADLYSLCFLPWAPDPELPPYK
ncbi:MAG: hypothetical protein IJW07_04020 [Lentisphaeria bacterium]|nr:hypothetical protein [Lentisphaeria bacterium]